MQVTTVHVDGPYQFDVTSDEQSMKFTNVRFEISGGAEFTFDLANNEFEGTATFTGIADQVKSNPAPHRTHRAKFYTLEGPKGLVKG